MTSHSTGAMFAHSINNRDPNNFLFHESASVHNTVLRFDGTDGKTIKSSSVVIGDSNDITCSSMSCSSMTCSSITVCSSMTCPSINMTNIDCSSITTVVLNNRIPDNFLYHGSTSLDNSIPRFNGVDGKTIQTSNVVIDDSQNISGINNLSITGYLEQDRVAKRGWMMLANTGTGLVSNNTWTQMPAMTTIQAYSPTLSDVAYDLDGSGSHFLINKAGFYTIYAKTYWPASTLGQRGLALYVNGQIVRETYFNALNSLTLNFMAECTFYYTLAINDTVDVYVYQNSGLSLNHGRTGSRYEALIAIYRFDSA